MNETIGVAMCGSFCTFSKVIPQMKELINAGYKVKPIMSEIAYSTDTRFGTALDFRREIEEICGEKIISEIKDAEPIGPKKLLDIMLIVPCTGNTIGKLANGIFDSCVTLAAKAHLRNNRPLVIGVSTNDALGTSAVNIGRLLNNKNIFFIPMRQDDCINKPNSIVADFEMTVQTVDNAICGNQLQPIYK